MKLRLFPAILVACFAVAVGDFGFRTFNPATTPEYMINEVVRPFYAATDGEPKKHLYLRRTWRLTEAPEHAWLQLIGHDSFEVFVNGRRAGKSERGSYGRTVGMILDVTRLMHQGENSVAVHATQLVLDRPPQVAISGEFRFADGEVTQLQDPKGWKATNIYDRRGPFWYETEFEDEHWAAIRQGDPVRWAAQVDVPPRAVTRPRESSWISPPRASDGAAVVARKFNLDGPPRDGWLRVLTTGSHRVAVNGYALTREQVNLGIRQPTVAREETFDISPLLRRGENTVSILAETPGEPPRAIADLEATTLAGERTYLATDGQWRGAVGLATDWLSPDLNEDHWQQCIVETGYVGVVPRTMVRELVEIAPGGAFWAARCVIYAAWIAGAALIGGLGASFVGWLLTRIQSADATQASTLPFVSLVPSAVAGAVGALMTWDLAWGWQDVYQPLWLASLWLLVLAQWLLLLAVSGGRVAIAGVSTSRTDRTRLERAAIAICWLFLVGVALWLRLRDIVAEPIHHDEVTAYAVTATVFDHGFPGGQVHPDIPFGYVATNELCYYFNALASLFFDDPLLVIRVPAVVFSMLSLALVAYIGWKWFNPYVGLVAGVLFAVSPHTIGMADFGRYLSQVQFFTLLTMWLTYEAVRGNGPPNTRLTWLAAVSFIAMYYSWEGAGMFGLGLAAAVFFHRRRHLKPLLASPHLYLASTVVVLAILAQNAHRIMQQTQRLWYGEGISSLTIKAMWRYPFFQHDYCLMNSSWIKDALLPMLALLIAFGLAVGHRWRMPLRFSIICLLGNAEVMAAFLPVRTNRYSYHLSSIFILIASAALVAMAEALLKHLRASQLPAAHRWYSRAVAAGVVVVAVALMSGWTLRTAEMTRYVTGALDLKQLRIPDWDEPMEYLAKNIKEGDVIVSILPHTTNYMFAVEKAAKGEPGEPRTVDYWVQSRLVLQATVGDTKDVPRDRRSGAIMLYNLEQVQKLFASHDRIWYCTLRWGQSALNDSTVSKYLREHMDVVSEDYATSLMVRDKNHRPAPIRLEEEEAGRLATDYYLR